MMIDDYDDYEKRLYYLSISKFITINVILIPLDDEDRNNKIFAFKTQQ